MPSLPPRPSSSGSRLLYALGASVLSGLLLAGVAFPLVGGIGLTGMTIKLTG